ncbi:hypothetical protein RFI_00659 [Reticulomyxa filosa]|uniref:Uncharacterized protein n=1 Tax=Reticulomyxa filosa TaxID=46433 RepID=X6PFG8_RETFI|nr:hypothetical protein RFI_00659 [Reticulomyxa filosa]|eukprot:ETO36402.1 hypothetical protein RFI_00659 [Reticulomyxa filosa]
MLEQDFPKVEKEIISKVLTYLPEDDARLVLTWIMENQFYENNKLNQLQQLMYLIECFGTKVGALILLQEWEKNNQICHDTFLILREICLNSMLKNVLLFNLLLLKISNIFDTKYTNI